MGNNKEEKRGTFKGVNQVLYSWAIGYKHINNLLKNKQESNDLLAEIFGDNSEKRQVASDEFYKLAWNCYPELGPCTLQEVLTQFEYDRVFYKNYRDHTTHIVKTFLLGLYFYDQVSYIQEKVNEILPATTDKEANFLKIWTMTALYHDIGYLFENDEIQKKKDKWKTFKDNFNNMLYSPIFYIWNTKGITREKERNFIKTNKIYRESIETLGEIEAHDSSNKRIWELLQSGGKDTSLMIDESDNNGIYKYYEFAAKAPTKDGRQGYIDHGISSALLLGKVWYAFYDYVKIIKENEYDIQCLSPLKSEDICNLYSKLNFMEEILGLAVNAISLHNINKEIWDIDEAFAHKINLEDFRMSFEKIPFACLLRLCDELQLWDRSYFRKPEVEDKTVSGNEFQIDVSDNFIYLNFKSDEEQFKMPENYPHSEYYKLHKKLTTYLNEDEVNKILKCGIPQKKSLSIENQGSYGDIGEESLDGMKFKFCEEGENSEEEDSWLVGAVNLDEDVHFSSFYLKQSMEKNLPEELKGFGYHNIVAVYEDYNEIYYVPQKECVQVSERLIHHCLENWDFWSELREEIRRRIETLGKVFMDLPTQNSFQSLSDTQIMNYYEKHREAHTNLYVYARIPEVLDRGVPTFTTFLKNYLSTRAEELKDEQKLNEVFDILTYPEVVGYSGRKLLDMCDVISLINETSTEEERMEWKSSNGRFLIRMKPKVVQRIEKYTKDWKYWGYHGYRNRALGDFNYFVEKLRLEFTNKDLIEQENMLITRQRQAASRRIQMFAKYHIDEKYQILFETYSQIGTIKLERRYHQLMNFYYLDQLLFEIAKRHGISESVVRCMLPDEISRLLRGDKTVLKEAVAREKAGTFVYQLTDEQDVIIYGAEAKAEAERMRNITDCGELINNELHGEVASIGTYRGICRVISKESNGDFEKGEILVATDIDPDKFELLKLAGAVITETGGFTCHAAIVCRELQIPCIVGIHELTRYIRTGQCLDIDANKGRVKIIESMTSEIIRLNDFNEKKIVQTEIGAKAYSLFVLENAGIAVPGFFCVRIDALKETLLKENLCNEQSTNSLLADIQSTLNEMNNEWWAIRSSTNREDGKFSSGAGQEITVLRVHKSDVVSELSRIIKGMKGYCGGGSIIIQKMILGSYSGVVFTNNPIGDANELVIQAVPGGNEYLTSGKVNPASYIYRKDLYQFREPQKGIWENLLSESLKNKLKDLAIQIAKLFGTPQDIEWTAQEECIYILQSRNITDGSHADQINIFSVQKELVVNTLSIYQAYALPIHLREHLLRTAAIVCWILDHWKGQQLNEEIMIKACLLHDIGNIVKGTDDRFKIIFPDVFSEECWQYWLNVRKHIGEKYGKTDIEATLNIAKEINVGDEVLKLIEQKQFSHNKENYLSENFMAKICAYADQRVSPNGILSLEGRLDEARTRHRGLKGSSVNNPEYESLKQYAKKIEAQIFEFVEGSPEDINDKSIDGYIMALKLYEF